MGLQAIIVGFGKMGVEIERVLLERGHGVIGRVDPRLPHAGSREGEALYATLNEAPFERADVVLDFSSAEAVENNLTHYLVSRVASVIGTTGWSMPAQILRDKVEQAKVGCIIGTNFSVGAHIFFRLLARAARMIGNFPQYDIMVHEVHHKQKIDSPSGTALTAAHHIIENHPDKTRTVTDTLQRAIKKEELHVSSLRGGSVHGFHAAIVDAPEDTIEISHRARSRAGFALGAVLAAEWITERTGLHTMDGYMNELIGHTHKGQCTCT